MTNKLLSITIKRKDSNEILIITEEYIAALKSSVMLKEPIL